MGGFVLEKDGGDTYAWRGAEVRIKASGEDTLGQLGVMEFVYPPGLAVPTHHHDARGLVVTGPSAPAAPVVAGGERLR